MLTNENEEVVTKEDAGFDKIEQERSQMLERSIELDNQQRELAELEASIDSDAKTLEEQIRKLAKEEAEIQQRKQTLQHEARAIGDRRTQLMVKTKELTRQRGSLTQKEQQLEQLQDKVEQDQALAEQQRAFEESLTGARIERVDSDPQESPKTGAERRTSKRVAVAVDVSFHTEHNFFMGLTENLSEGGLFVATYDDIPMGTELQVELNLPGHDTIAAKGVVRWIREYSKFTEDVAPGVGVELEGLSDADQEAIREFLSQRDPIYYETM